MHLTRHAGRAGAARAAQRVREPSAGSVGRPGTTRQPLKGPHEAFAST